MGSLVRIGIAGVLMSTLACATTAGGGSAGTVEAGDQVAVLQAKADAARARVATLARQGGWAYKTGAIDREKRDAARFQAQADAARASTAGEPTATPYVSPELAAARARLRELRQAGGWAYKSGAIERAEADVRALSGPPEVMMGLYETARPTPNWGKPIEKIQRTYR